MKLLWEEKAWEEYCEWQNEDKKTLKRINSIIKDIQRGTFDGIGKPEPLKDNLRGWWSRRIDETNRIVYCEKENAIIILLFWYCNSSNIWFQYFHLLHV